MAFLLDTDVVIHLRDGDSAAIEKVSTLGDAVLLSIVTRVELEDGVYRDPAFSQVRRARLDTLLTALPPPEPVVAPAGDVGAGQDNGGVKGRRLQLSRRIIISRDAASRNQNRRCERFELIVAQCACLALCYEK